MTRTLGFAVVFGLVMIPGCGFRDREGLLARFRARLSGPDYVYMAPTNSYPVGYELGMPIQGLPVSLNGGLPCPCSTVPGLPNYLGAEVLPPVMTPWPQTYPTPSTPSTPSQPGTTPGTAPTKPAEPSDGNGNQRSTPLATSKPSGL